MKSTILRLILAALFLPSITKADADPSIATYEQLDALRSQNAILSEQVKQSEMKSKINSQTPIIPVITGNSGSTSYVKNRQPSNFIDYSARVKLVSGVGDNKAATIMLSTGGSRIARVGSKIQGLGQVKSITANEVIVVSGKETYSIPFDEENYNNINSSSNINVPAINVSPIPLGSN